MNTDAVATFSSGGRTYLITANEGDARDYRGYAEEVRVGDRDSAGTVLYPLDATAFPDADDLRDPTRAWPSDREPCLAATWMATATTIASTSSVGVRCRIRDQQGRLVWDSGDLLEQLSKTNDESGVNLFNTDSGANSRDNRSDNKGIEPEAVVVGEVDGVPYAFVGLERDSGIVVFDLSQPSAPRLVTYVNRRSLLAGCSNSVDCGDLGPEGLTFVSESDSPSGAALLIVSNEVSSTTTVWKIE